MDTHDEIARERTGLLKADLDIRNGEDRIRKQRNVIFALQINGRETREAERLLHLLRRTLELWQDHRKLMVLRIQHLEALSAKESAEVL